MKKKIENEKKLLDRLSAIKKETFENVDPTKLDRNFYFFLKKSKNSGIRYILSGFNAHDCRNEAEFKEKMQYYGAIAKKQIDNKNNVLDVISVATIKDLIYGGIVNRDEWVAKFNIPENRK